MNKYKNAQSRKSFTLAEMLITLTVVSVLAIITLPSLFYKIDDFKWNSARQKMVYNIREATRRIAFQNAGGIGSLGNAANFRDQLSNYLSSTKSCGTVTDCFSATIKNIAGNAVATPTSGAVGLILNNGAGLNITYNSACTENNLENTGWSAEHVCANIIFDINGPSPPNQVGKDIGFSSIIDPKTITVTGVSPDIADYTEGATTFWNWSTAQIKCKSKGESWYLPNKDELNSLNFNEGIIGNLAEFYYLSSTEYAPDPSQAWSLNFELGTQSYWPKTVAFRVRCVRR